MSRMLKELKSLTPFGWDKKLETHRPGKAMLRDWEKMDDLAKAVDSPHTISRTRRADMPPLLTPGSISQHRLRHPAAKGKLCTSGRTSGPSEQSTEDCISKDLSGGGTPVGPFKASYCTPRPASGATQRLKASSAGPVSALSVQQHHSAHVTPLPVTTAFPSSVSTAALRVSSTAATASGTAPVLHDNRGSVRGRGSVDTCSSPFAAMASLADEGTFTWHDADEPMTASHTSVTLAAGASRGGGPLEPAARGNRAAGADIAESDAAINLSTFGSTISTGLDPPQAMDDKEVVIEPCGGHTSTSQSLPEHTLANRPAPPQATAALLSVSAFSHDVCGTSVSALCPPSDAVTGCKGRVMQQEQAASSFGLEPAVTIGPDGIPEVPLRAADAAAHVHATKAGTCVAMTAAPKAAGVGNGPELLSATVPQPPVPGKGSVAADVKSPKAAAAASEHPSLSAVHGLAPSTAGRLATAQDQQHSAGVPPGASVRSTSVSGRIVSTLAPAFDAAKLLCDSSSSAAACPPCCSHPDQTTTSCAGDTAASAGDAACGASPQPVEPGGSLAAGARHAPAPEAPTSAACEFGAPTGVQPASPTDPLTGPRHSTSMNGADGPEVRKEYSTTAVVHQAAAAQANKLTFADLVKAVAALCHSKGAAANMQTVAMLLQLQQRRTAACHPHEQAASNIKPSRPDSGIQQCQTAFDPQPLPAIMPLLLPRAMPIEETVSVPLRPAIVSVHLHLLRGLQTLQAQSQARHQLNDTTGPSWRGGTALPGVHAPAVAPAAKLPVSAQTTSTDGRQQLCTEHRMHITAAMHTAPAASCASARHAALPFPGIAIVPGVAAPHSLPVAGPCSGQLASCAPGGLQACVGAVRKSLMDEEAICVLRLAGKRDAACVGSASAAKSRNWKKAKCMI